MFCCTLSGCGNNLFPEICKISDVVLPLYSEFAPGMRSDHVQAKSRQH